MTDELIAFYRERARGKTGLIIAGAAGVDPGRVNQAGMMQIYSDSHIPPMRKHTHTVHEEGGKIFLQLMHTGAYAKQHEYQGKNILVVGAGMGGLVYGALAAGGTMVLPDYGVGEEACILPPRPIGRSTVVIGSGYKAVQTALYCALARRRGEEEQNFLEQYSCEDINHVNNIIRRGSLSVTLLSPGKRRRIR